MMTEPETTNITNFRRLSTAAAFISLLAYAIEFTITPASINEIGRHYDVGLSSLCWLPRLLMAGFFVAVLAAGRYSDKKGKLPTLLIGCTCMTVGLFLFAWAPSFNIALLAMLLMGIGGGSSEGTAMAMMADLYAGNQRTAMMNWAQAVFGVGAVAAPFAIGRLFKLGINWQLGYIGAAAISIMGLMLALIAISMRMEKVVGEHEKGESWRKVLSNRMVFWLSVGMMLYVGAEGGPATWLAAFFERDLHSTASLAAYSLAFFWAGILLGRIVGAWISKWLSDSAIIKWSLALAAVFQTILLIMHDPIPAIITAFVLGLFLAPVFPTIASIAGSVYPQQSGTVLGIVVAAGSLGGVIFPPTIGWLADRLDMRLALWTCFVILVLNLVIFLRIRIKPEKQ